MSGRGPKKKAKSNEPIDPTSLRGLKAAFFEHLEIRHFSPETLRTRGNALDFFLRWCDERGLTQPSEITRPMLEQYRKHIYLYRLPNGKPLSLSTQVGRLIAIRTFFKWMTKQYHILYNPASELEMPRLDKKLPANVMTVQEVETVIGVTNINDPLGLRDRAILETLYSTGMRRGELTRLKLYELSLDQGTAMIRGGKFRKDRVVPIGDRAIAWVDKYLLDVRSALVQEPDEGVVFLTIDGTPLSGKQVGHLAHDYIEQSKIGKGGSCHVFRHAMATHMLEGGADIRIIQAILGHEALTTTEIYTRVSIQHIKAVHSKTHPASSLKREKSDKKLNPAERRLLARLASEAEEESEDDSDQ